MLNSLRETIARQSTQPLRWRDVSHLVFAVLFGIAAIALVALAAWILDEPPSVFTREPQQVLDGSFYVGSFSNLGGLIWFSAAAILSFAAVLKRSDRGALILAAALTWAMGIDDIFMLHDRIYPKIFLSDPILYLLYFGTIGVIILRFHRQISFATLVGIVITVTMWVLSAGIDEFRNNPTWQLAEDGVKFIGIAVWAAAWIRQAYSDVSKLARSGSSTPV